MSLITDDWRLKLLALVLAVLMLGAVAFSQNPPTKGTVTVGLNYDTASDIVILNPPAQAQVSFSGLADAISQVSVANVTATVDAAHAKPGTGVKLNVHAGTSVPGVTVQDPPPIVVNIDIRSVVTLTVQVRAHEAAGYHITQESATCAGVTPCVVHFDGPLTWEQQNMVAAVVYSPLVNVTDISQPTQPITLLTNNGIIDSTRKTQPSWQLDVSTADITIHASPGVTSNTVPLVDAPPANGPPPGYHIVGISINPPTIVVIGDPAALAKVPRIVLPAVDLSGATTTVSIQVNIPFPNGVTSLNGIQKATVTYTIQANPSVSPAPSPS
jgi:YbbR domain-containing protein